MYTYMIKTGLYPDTTSVNILALYYFSIVIAILCLNSPIIFTFFNVFFSRGSAVHDVPFSGRGYKTQRQTTKPYLQV